MYWKKGLYAYLINMKNPDKIRERIFNLIIYLKENL